MLFSTGLSDRDEGHDDIRGKHSAEQPKSYMKGHPSSPVVKPLAGLYLNSEGAFLVPLAPGQVSSNAIKGAGYRETRSVSKSRLSRRSNADALTCFPVNSGAARGFTATRLMMSILQGRQQ